MIKDSRDRCLLALEEKLISQGITNINHVHAFGVDINIKINTIYDLPYDLCARHGIHHSQLLDVDNAAYDRSKGRSALGDNSKNSVSSVGGSNSRNHGIPSVLTDLISKLPVLAAGGPDQDIEGFLRQLKSITLPPRPLVEIEADFVPIGTKRAAELAMAAGQQGMSGDNAQEDGIDYEDEGDHPTQRDDVFRQRQRARRS